MWARHAILIAFSDLDLFSEQFMQLRSTVRRGGFIRAALFSKSRRTADSGEDGKRSWAPVYSSLGLVIVSSTVTESSWMLPFRSAGF